MLIVSVLPLRGQRQGEHNGNSFAPLRFPDQSMINRETSAGQWLLAFVRSDNSFCESDKPALVTYQRNIHCCAEALQDGASSVALHECRHGAPVATRPAGKCGVSRNSISCSPAKMAGQIASSGDTRFRPGIPHSDYLRCMTPSPAQGQTAVHSQRRPSAASGLLSYRRNPIKWAGASYPTGPIPMLQ